MHKLESNSPYRGSFRSKEIQGRITPAKQSHDSLALASAEDLLPQKNKKKKKKRPVGRQVSAELKGKDTVKVYFSKSNVPLRSSCKILEKPGRLPDSVVKRGKRASLYN